MNYQNIDSLKNKLDELRPLKKEAIINLQNNFIVESTYNTNAIEGNSLTLKETKVVLEGITIGGKTLREHFEIINHKDAIFFVEQLAKSDTPLTEFDIKGIHSLILKNIDNKNAGKYRDINVRISGAEHTPPKHFELSLKMNQFIEWYKESRDSLHSIELAARVHVDFVKIHPFIDGNGRTARLLLNLELIKRGYPPIVIKAKNRLSYYEALDLAHVKNDYSYFLKLINEYLIESFDRYFFYL